jgi:hypothetical protein
MAALVLVGIANAHLSAEPSFLEVGGKQRIVLTVHNDRHEPMTGFRLTVPDDLRILGTGGSSGWNEGVQGTAATWTGSSLAPDTPATFEVDLEAVTLEPGTVELQGDQLYAGEESVTWPVSLTVVPPGGSPPENDGGVGGTAIAILAALGALVAVSFGAVLWQRRRGGSLQEK